MQTSSASTARAVRAGIRLSTETFKHATRKALDVRPRVVHFDSTYWVRRSDDGVAVVRFRVFDGSIWGLCDCTAARRALPCYHIAAAALSRSLEQDGGHVGDPHAVIDPPQLMATLPAGYPETHSHHCPACAELHECGAPACAEIDSLTCWVCDAAEADLLAGAGSGTDRAYWV